MREKFIMKYIFTCGGTAGHINPAISIAQKIGIKYPGSEFLFIGAEGQMESRLVPLAGYDVKCVKITNISRGHSVEDLKHNAETVHNVAHSIIQARKIIKEFAPDAVIGTGGYVCYPVIIAAHDLGIRTYIHESNAVPGLTTSMLCQIVDRVLLGFEDSSEHYRNKSKLIYTGTPVRAGFDSLSKIEAKKKLGLDGDKKLVLSVWGSLGSGHMNSIMQTASGFIKNPGYKIIHATGSGYYAGFNKYLEENGITTDPDFEIREYIYDMPVIMRAADLVMCRAGASTLSELSYLGLPALIVPSPNVTNNHQEKNARLVENAGGAKVLLEGEFDAEGLFGTVDEILNDEGLLLDMSAAMGSLSKRDSADIICNIVTDRL